MKHRFLQNNWGIWILTAVLIVVIFLCLSFRQPALPLSVTVVMEGGSHTLACQQVRDGEYCVFLPGSVTLEQVFWRLDTTGTVTVGGKTVENGASCATFCPEEVYELRWAEGSGTLTFRVSANVNTLYLDTRSGAMDYIHLTKGNEESGAMTVYTSNGSIAYTGALAEVKGRGNYSWDAFDKKPYSLTLPADADLLGMGESSRWVLLANAADASLVKNKVVYDFARAVGMAAPDSRWVDVYLNGEYAGLYLLCQRNEIRENRVDGDWLVSLELESRLVAQNYPHITLASGQALRVHDPKNPDLTALEDLWQTVEDSLRAGSWQETIDAASWAQKYLVEEIFANIDGCLISQYFYGKDGAVYAGPVWDFDISMGDPDAWQLEDPRTFFANLDRQSGDVRASWFYDLYQDPEFYALVTRIYREEFLPALEDLLETKITAAAVEIAEAHAMDQYRWGKSDSLAMQTAEILDYLRQRVDFLTDVWVEGKTYCYVYADYEWGGCFALETGDCLTDLPIPEDTESARFVGWYYEDTDEPVDPTRPVTTDLRIYPKWETLPGGIGRKILMLAPVGLLGVSLLALLVADHRKNRGK